MKVTIALVACAALAVQTVARCELVAPSAGAAPKPLNVLYFGNSYTHSVPTLVSDLADLAGHPRPYTRDASAPSVGLQHHVDYNTVVIGNSLPTGQKWDYVVLQDHSLQPTRLGSLPLHLSSSLALYGLVAQHSPEVTAVMFQTWARGPGHSFYNGAFAPYPGGPTQMHQELRDGYHLAAEQISDRHGAGAAVVAPVGDAWAASDFSRSFYTFDIHHPSNSGILLSALTIYATIYGDTTVTDLPLQGLLSRLSIDPQDGALLVASVQATLLATASAIPEPSVWGVTLIGCVAVCAQPRRFHRQP